MPEDIHGKPQSIECLVAGGSSTQKKTEAKGRGQIRDRGAPDVDSEGNSLPATSFEGCS